MPDSSGSGQVVPCDDPAPEQARWKRLGMAMMVLRMLR